MRFVTRANVHVDRIASAWLIRRFVDPGATFLFVDRNADVSQLDAVPFDMRGAKLGHHGGFCTFEVLLEAYELRDPILRRMGEIIRAIDIPGEDDRHDVTTLKATFDELRDLDIEDDERLVRGAAVCEDLYERLGGVRAKREV